MAEQVSREAFVAALQLRAPHLTAEEAWHQFAYALAERLRCADFALLSGLAAEAIRLSESHVAERQGAAAVVAIRDYLLEPWEMHQASTPDSTAVERKDSGDDSTGVADRAG